MDKGIPIGLLQLSPCLNVLWKKGEITCRKRGPPAQDAPLPHVEKGTDRGVATIQGRMRTIIPRTPEKDGLVCPLQLVIPLEIDHSGENVHYDK